MGLWAELRSHPIRRIKMLMLLSTALCSGLNVAVVGPTMVNLQLRTGSTVTQSAFTLNARSAGACFGALMSMLLLHSTVAERLQVMTDSCVCVSLCLCIATAQCSCATFA